MLEELAFFRIKYIFEKKDNYHSYLIDENGKQSLVFMARITWTGSFPSLEVASWETRIPHWLNFSGDNYQAALEDAKKLETIYKLNDIQF